MTQISPSYCTARGLDCPAQRSERNTKNICLKPVSSCGIPHNNWCTACIPWGVIDLHCLCNWIQRLCERLLLATPLSVKKGFQAGSKVTLSLVSTWALLLSVLPPVSIRLHGCLEFGRVRPQPDTILTLICVSILKYPCVLSWRKGLLCQVTSLRAQWKQLNVRWF